MKVNPLAEMKTLVRDDGVAMTDFFGAQCAAGEGVSMGHAVFPPGTVVPPASHTGDEYSFILKGCARCRVGETVHTMHAGSAGFIPAGEVHESFNDTDEDCELIWMLIEK